MKFTFTQIETETEIVSFNSNRNLTQKQIFQIAKFIINQNYYKNDFNNQTKLITEKYIITNENEKIEYTLN
jgi:hypothetical protein